MSTVNSSKFSERAGRASAPAQFGSRLSSLVYRSRCVEPWSPGDLDRMVDASRVRNRAGSVTGLLICDGDEFFQWLEGPTDSLARLWRSIRQDRRHTGIEVLGDAPTPARFFGDWDMKLATRHSLDPEAVRRTAAGLAASRAGSVVAPGFDRPGSRSDADAGVAASVAEHPRVGELARLLMAADPGASSRLIEELHAQDDTLASLCATVFEPAARVLGDLWSTDDCSEFDVTLGMCRLQSAVRVWNSAASPRVIPVSRLRSVLVAPMPGEMHALGATFDAEVLWQAGWDMRCELPDTNAALCRLLAGQWFDALDLSLSAAFEREHWLPRLRQTIAFARAASRNPTLMVVVGGRAFHGQIDRHTQVGADAGCATAQRIESVLTGLLTTAA